MEDGFFRKVTIIGVGLIGGSIGLCLKKKEKPPHIVGLGRRQSSLQKALNRGAVDSVTTSLEDAVSGSDLIVICTPVGRIVEFIKELATIQLPEACLITDVGSTKQIVVEAASEYLSLPKQFVAAHPLAGSENSGVEHASALLFEGAKCLLTPFVDVENNVENVDRIKKFWESLGCNVIKVTPAEHDQLLALSSHLPHLLAPALVQTARKHSDVGLDIAEVFAGSFRDMTRIASSDPQLWLDIFLSNRNYILKALEEFQSNLQQLADLLSRLDAESLRDELLAIKNYRDEIYHGRKE